MLLRAVGTGASARVRRRGSAVDADGVFGISGSSTAVFGSSGSDMLPAVVGYAFNSSTGLQGYSGTAASAPLGRFNTGVPAMPTRTQA